MWSTPSDADSGILRDPLHVARLILDNVPDGMNLLDVRTGRYVYLNPRQEALGGFTLEQLNDMP